jgi:DNA-binding HxlR family transcriptional regulator
LKPKPRDPKARSRSNVERRSSCPIACSLDLIGDKWTLLVVRDLFAGKQHYHEFADSPERIATNILADRLKKLGSSGLVAASPSTQRVGSCAYTLTQRGRSLYPVLEALRDWGLSSIQGTKAHIQVPPPS